MEPATMGGRSETPYDFHEEEVNDIIQVASYHCEQLRCTVIHFSAACHEPILSSIATPFPRSSRDSRQFRSLERLPLELLHIVIPGMDMQSVFNFRQTSLRLRDAVDSLPQYQLIVSYGLDLYCALLRTQHAPNVTLFDFHSVLCTKKCAFCDNFGDFISLLIWQRCCFRCIQLAPQASVQTLQSARTNYASNTNEAHQLMSLKLLKRESYATGQFFPHPRNSLVSTQHAQSAWSARPRRREREEVDRRNYQHCLSEMGACALPHYNTQKKELERGLSCAGCELNAAGRLWAARRAWNPWIPGISWIPRDVDEVRWTIYSKIYTRARFLEHFRWCKQAQRMWNLSKGGEELSFEKPDVALADGILSSSTLISIPGWWWR
ncbi:hypothetical protein NPX13_g8628 [Xylaria arbuscula]|uniref:F-box domain-containing protein n=1 Tax=Xylaria arbuscula TaxID=114810 RepID=A0A9W8TJ95_9PEZI|nr:hypothetical protein NPX13_g8628 [Xylaria arbuscula]